MAARRPLGASPEKESKLPRFAAWIKAVGPVKIARTLNVTRFSVQAWARGSISLAAGKTVRDNHGSYPSQDRLADLIALAKGQLTAADIFPPPQKRAK